jgi:hypothetical protein
MSFHTVIALTKWAVTAKGKSLEALEELKKLPVEERSKDPRLNRITAGLYYMWKKGSKMERMAVLGVTEHELKSLLVDLLSNLDRLRAEYSEELARHNIQELPPVTDADFDMYEKTVEEMRKNQL